MNEEGDMKLIQILDATNTSLGRMCVLDPLADAPAGIFIHELPLQLLMHFVYLI